MLCLKHRSKLTDEQVNDVWQTFIDPSQKNASQFTRAIENELLELLGWCDQEKGV